MEKRIVLIFYIHCVKLEECQESSFSHSFIAVFIFSFVNNATNFFIHSLNRFVLKKKKKKKLAYALLLFFNWMPFYFLVYVNVYLNAGKLDWEENLFDFYVESIAFTIKILMKTFIFYYKFFISVVIKHCSSLKYLALFKVFVYYWIRKMQIRHFSSFFKVFHCKDQSQYSFIH